MKAKLVAEKLPKPFRHGPKVPSEFAELWLSPMRVADIAARFNVRRQTLRGWCKRLGLPPRRGGARKVSVDEELFKRMWSEGVLTRDMVKAFGISRNTVNSIRNRLSLLERKNKMRRISDEKIRELWSSELTGREIGEELGISQVTLCKAIRRLDLPKRRQGFWGKPFQVGVIDGVTFATDEEYERLKAESMRVLEKILNPSQSDDFIALRKKYRQLGRTMARHMRILRVKPLERKH